MELAKSKEPVEAQESKTNADAGEPVASLQLCDELNLNAPELSTHMNNNWKDFFEDLFHILSLEKSICSVPEAKSAFFDATFVPAKKGGHSWAEVIRARAAQS